MNQTSKNKRRAISKKHPWKRMVIKPRKTQSELDESALFYESKHYKNTIKKRAKGLRRGL